jgi:hypothetical protein
LFSETDLDGYGIEEQTLIIAPDTRQHATLGVANQRVVDDPEMRGHRGHGLESKAVLAFVELDLVSFAAERISVDGSAALD